MQPSIPFRFQETQEDVRRLGTLLREAFQLIQFQPAHPASLLNLACGRADETGTLFLALAPTPIHFYLGIDLLPSDIEEASHRWLPTHPDLDLRFRCGDASRTDRMRQLPPFDLVFIRHQNYWHNAPQWDQLLENALTALKPQGILAFTSYFDREHLLALTALKSRGAELRFNTRHLASRTLFDAPNKSVDRHLAIVSRPS